MKWLLLVLVTLGLGSAAWGQSLQPPQGRWKIFHGDGRPIFVTVLPSGKAMCSGSEATQGHWKLQNGALELVWTDGWRDRIVVEGKGYRKWGYSPTTPSEGPPSHKTAAYRLSSK